MIIVVVVEMVVVVVVVAVVVVVVIFFCQLKFPNSSKKLKKKFKKLAHVSKKQSFFSENLNAYR